MRLEIKQKDGKWTINGKTSEQWSESEKKFFDDFIKSSTKNINQ